MALAPQIVNPTVIQPRIADVQAAQVQMADIQPVQAPRQIAPIQAPEVAQVRAFQSPIAASAAAPARGRHGGTAALRPGRLQGPGRHARRPAPGR